MAGQREFSIRLHDASIRNAKKQRESAMMTRLKLETIREAWGWVGLEPAEVIAVNLFGNLIIRSIDGAYWRICPEEWSCKNIASGIDEFNRLSADRKFRVDWEMMRLVELARQKLGELPDGRRYCLKQPAVIGGAYDAANLGTISLAELISFSGHMARQIKDVPDGAKITLKWAE
jgi:hypothetical protein